MKARSAPKARNSGRTKGRILNAAERLFSERGIDGVSVRQIASAAGVQLALITYYFGTKEGLYRAVFRRRIESISSQRLARLQEIMAQKDPPPTVEQVLDALARPWVELGEKRGGRMYTRLIAREVGDPREGSRGIVKELLDPIARDFIAAMEYVLPDRPRSEIHWAYHFFIGALLLVLLKPERVERLSGRYCNMGNGPEVVEEIVGLFARGLRASDGARGAQAGRKAGSSKGKRG